MYQGLNFQIIAHSEFKTPESRDVILDARLDSTQHMPPPVLISGLLVSAAYGNIFFPQSASISIWNSFRTLVGTLRWNIVIIISKLCQLLARASLSQQTILCGIIHHYLPLPNVSIAQIKFTFTHQLSLKQVLDTRFFHLATFQGFALYSPFPKQPPGTLFFPRRKR